MILKEKGRYYELPIIGLQFRELTFTGRLRIMFNDPEGSYLELHGPFKMTRYNQTQEFHPSSKEALFSLFDLFSVEITDAKADKTGGLFLTFANGSLLTVDDGPFENWHYTKVNRTNPLHVDALYVHGGVGRTVS